MNINFEEIETLKNEAFAIRCVELLNKYEKLDAYTLGKLTDGDWCKGMGFMRMSKPVLKKIPTNCSAEELKQQMLDGTKSNRFYSHTVRVNQSEYIITNYWYGPQTNYPDNRTPFLNWVKQILK